MKKIHLLVLVCCLSLTAVAGAGELSIDSRHANKGDFVTFTVSVTHASNAVAALIMDIVYDPGAMAYAGYQRGSLGSSGYPMLIVNEYKPGVIRVGAADPLDTGIAQGDSGPFLHLDFEVTGNKECAVSFGVLHDDLHGWITSPGYLIRDDIDQQSETPHEQTPDEPEEKSHSIDDVDTSQDLSLSGDKEFFGQGGYHIQEGIDSVSPDSEGQPQGDKNPQPHERIVQNRKQAGKALKSLLAQTDSQGSPAPSQPETSPGGPNMDNAKVGAINAYRDRSAPGSPLQGEWNKPGGPVQSLSSRNNPGNFLNNKGESGSSTKQFYTSENGKSHIPAETLSRMTELMKVIVILLALLLLAALANMGLLAMLYRRLLALDKSETLNPSLSKQDLCRRGCWG